DDAAASGGLPDGVSASGASGGGGASGRCPTLSLPPQPARIENSTRERPLMPYRTAAAALPASEEGEPCDGRGDAAGHAPGIFFPSGPYMLFQRPTRHHSPSTSSSTYVTSRQRSRSRTGGASRCPVKPDQVALGDPEGRSRRWSCILGSRRDSGLRVVTIAAM